MSAIDTLVPGQWYEIPDTKFNDKTAIWPDPVPPRWDYPNPFAYSGACYDSSRDRMILFGGGHGDYSGNEIYAFNLGTLTWSRVSDPTPDIATYDYDTGVAYQYYHDGLPPSSHTRDGLAYLPTQDALYVTNCSTWYLAGAMSEYWTWEFSFATGLWSHTATLPQYDSHSDNYTISQCAYDPTTGYVFACNEKVVRRYDPVGKTWVADELGYYNNLYKACAAIDPINNVMVWVGGTHLAVQELESPWTITHYIKSQVSGDNQIMDANCPGVEYNSELGKIVAWTNESGIHTHGRDVYVVNYDVPSIEVWHPSNAYSTTPGASRTDGTYGRFCYIPSRDIFVLINQPDENVCAYKMGTKDTTALSVPGLTSTINCIGVQLDITGDANDNAACTCQYRKTGAIPWNDALPLFRSYHDQIHDAMIGSIFNLDEGAGYDVKVDYTDPDGFTSSQEASITTKSTPVLAAAIQTYYVIPGSGGGDGSLGNPFQGLAAAQAAAQPGYTFLLHAGDYGSAVNFTHAGTAGNYIAWKAYGDGYPVICGTYISGSYQWFEGLKLTGAIGINGNAAIKYSGTPVVSNIVIKANYILSLETYNAGTDGTTHLGWLLYMGANTSTWYIADNLFEGDEDPSVDTYPQCEGIESFGSYHTICYNAISHVTDGISFGTSQTGTNVDIFGNDIYDVSDDGIEMDYGGPNTRCWGNRVTNAHHNAISMQDADNGALWYVIRNQLMNYDQNFAKVRDQYRWVFLHNTVVTAADLLLYQDEYIQYAYAKNNLFISYNGGQMIQFHTYTRNSITDLDYNGYDAGGKSNPFGYMSVSYANLAAYSAATGAVGSRLDEHSVEVDRDLIFTGLTFGGPVPALSDLQYLTLAAGCAAVDAGIVLPNINDGYTGSAPDLGAYEYGAALPQYGPRAGYVSPPRNLTIVR